MPCVCVSEGELSRLMCKCVCTSLSCIHYNKLLSVTPAPRHAVFAFLQLSVISVTVICNFKDRARACVG